MTERRLTVLEARRDFGNLVLDAQAGHVTVVTRYGRPAAVISPVRQQEPRTRTEQLGDYFRLLISLAEKAEDKQRRDELFDRIERAIAAVAAVAAEAAQ